MTDIVSGPHPLINLVLYDLLMVNVPLDMVTLHLQSTGEHLAHFIARSSLHRRCQDGYSLQTAFRSGWYWLTGESNICLACCFYFNVDHVISVLAYPSRQTNLSRQTDLSRQIYLSREIDPSRQTDPSRTNKDITRGAHSSWRIDIWNEKWNKIHTLRILHLIPTEQTLRSKQRYYTCSPRILKDNYMEQKCTLHPTDTETDISSSVTYSHLISVDQPFHWKLRSQHGRFSFHWQTRVFLTRLPCRSCHIHT